MSLYFSELVWTTPAIFVILFLLSCWQRTARVELPAGKKKVPIVSGGWPLIGHGLWLHLNNVKFLKKCYEQYGGIFQIKLFLANMVIICDRRLVPIYFKQREDSLSFKRVMDGMNLDWTVCDDEIFNSTVARKIFKQSVTFDKNLTLCRIHEEGNRIVDNLKLLCTEDGAYECVLNDEFHKFVIRTILVGILRIPFSDNLYRDLMKYYRFADKMTYMSFLIPKKLLKLSCRWRVLQIRRTFVPHFEKEIQKYRDDFSKSDSVLIRWAVDLKVNNGTPSTEQIIQVIIGFLFASTRNLALALSNAIIYAALPENFLKLKKLREVCKNYSGDLSRLLLEPVLNGWIMESARLSAHMYSVQRVPTRSETSLGDYHIGNNVDYVTLSGVLLQVYGNAEEIYKYPTNFIPDRYSEKPEEPKPASHIVVWGGGEHICPGKDFSINYVKIAFAQLLLNFDFKIDQEISEFNYTFAGAFASKNLTVRISQTNQLRLEEKL